MKLTAERAKQLISYDQETGLVTRITRPCNKTKVGAVIGSLSKKGYLAASFDNKRMLLHRVIWLYMTGSWPDGAIDHINGTKTDNRWANLRLASSFVNAQNIRKARADSVTGLLGAFPKRNRYVAEINVHKRRVHIGSFPTAQEAHEAYIKAKRQLHEGSTL